MTITEYNQLMPGDYIILKSVENKRMNKWLIIEKNIDPIYFIFCDFYGKVFEAVNPWSIMYYKKTAKWTLIDFL